MSAPKLLSEPILRVGSVRVGTVITLRRLTSTVLFVFSTSRAYKFRLSGRCGLLGRVRGVFSRIPMCCLFGGVSLVRSARCLGRCVSSRRGSVFVSTVRNRNVSGVGTGFSRVGGVSHPPRRSRRCSSSCCWNGLLMALDGW